MKTLLLVAFASLVGLGCPAQTEFRGDSTFPKGPRGCYDQCAAGDMEMAAFVYVGSYSTACACRLKGTGAEQTPSEAGAVAAQAAAAAGVEMQRRRNEERARASIWKPKKKPSEPYRPIYKP